MTRRVSMAAGWPGLRVRPDLMGAGGGLAMAPYIEVPALPFQIPLGALLPRRVANLIAGARTSGRLTLPTAVTGCIPWNGTSVKLPARWQLTVCAAVSLPGQCMHRPILCGRFRRNSRVRVWNLPGLGISIWSKATRTSTLPEPEGSLRCCHRPRKYHRLSRDMERVRTIIAQGTH